MARPRVAVLQPPGVNCERETVAALEGVGLAAEVFRWTASPAALTDYDAYVLPGGFSWQDRVRAGALAAKAPMMDALADAAARGRPVLGICNGAQVLVEAGLVPGGDGVALALARNQMPDRAGYYARWVHLRLEPSPCVFTRHLDRDTPLPLPMAHGEGRFVSATDGLLDALLERGQVPLRYAARDGSPAATFPDNPNGSTLAAAGVCNAAGNVLALMPHPERAFHVGQLARGIGGAWGARRAAWADAGHETNGDASAGGVPGGPGRLLFEGLARHLEVA